MTLNNKQRRELLDRARASGYTGSIIDVYQGHRQGRDVIAEFEAQKQGNIAVTPSQQQAGLGPAHQAGRTGESMIFPNIGPNATMTTANKGLKVNLDVKGYDDRGHLVKSYDSVPPGVKTLPMGPRATTVVETPARYRAGGPKKYQDAGGLPPADFLGDLAERTDSESTRTSKKDPTKDPLYLRGHSFNTDDPETRRILKDIHDGGIHIQTPEGTKSSYTVPTEQYDFLIRKLDELGNPDLRGMSQGDLRHTLFGGRAHTNAKDVINIDTTKTSTVGKGRADGMVDQILKEIPHIQLAQGDGDIKGEGTLRNSLGIVRDIINAGGDQGKTYKTPGTVEHTTHSVLEPELREEYEKTRKKRRGGPKTVKRGRKRHARSIRQYAHHVKGEPAGSKSTHLMSTFEGDGKYYVIPTITTDREGYRDQSFDEALAAGEVYEFKNKKRAERFAKGSWKKRRDRKLGGFLSDI